MRCITFSKQTTWNCLSQVYMQPRQFKRVNRINQKKELGDTVHKHPNADALIRSVRSSFEQIEETPKGKPKISKNTGT